MALSFSNLRNSITALEKSLNVANKIDDKESDLFETVRAGVIQNYKICYEVAWKSIKKQLKEKSVEVKGITIKNLYVKAKENEIIDDVEKWMEFHKARNTTFHVHEIAFQYLDYAKELLKRLEVE